MRKMFSVITVLGLVVSLFTIADAGFGKGQGGCSDCVQQVAPTDQFKKFQSDTIDLRQEMMGKRFEMQRENLKGTPDTAKIASLQAEIKAIQAKIQDIRTLSGLPNDKCDGECFQKNDKHDRKNMGGCGKGGAGGCNNGPCGGQK